tara:strand:+ start:573 stop:1346 length:774 start_codon:yes stop_codon:yes gene_type:complete
MGAGGSNYAQNALATLFTEQFRNQGAIGPNDNPRNLQEMADAMAYNKARQEGLIPNEELVGQYTPESTPVGETTEDVTRRFTEGTGAVPTSQSTGLQGILDKIAAQQKALDELEFTRTTTRKVPVYSYTTQGSGTPGLAGSRPGVAKTTTQLPRGTVNRPASSWQDPGGLYSPSGVRYTQSGTRNITETFTRPAKAGDPEYDKKKRMLDALQGQYDTRSKYASPSATGIQGLIAEPIVNQPQTGYNNINEIMRRYIG